MKIKSFEGRKRLSDLLYKMAEETKKIEDEWTHIRDIDDHNFAIHISYDGEWGDWVGRIYFSDNPENEIIR